MPIHSAFLFQCGWLGPQTRRFTFGVEGAVGDAWRDPPYNLLPLSAQASGGMIEVGSTSMGRGSPAPLLPIKCGCCTNNITKYSCVWCTVVGDLVDTC